MLKLNTVYLKRKNKISLDGYQLLDNKIDSNYVRAFDANLLSLGYQLSESLKEKLQYINIEELALLHDEVVGTLRSMLGAHVKYEPMYPNFPKQVQDTPEDELYSNAFMHYLGDTINTRIKPFFQKEERKPLFEGIYRKIELGTNSEIESYLKDLLNSKIAFSYAEVEDLDIYIKLLGDDILGEFPSKFVNKENLSSILALLLENNITNVNKLLKEHIHTATDILRLITAQNKGDVSLGANTKFKNISRANRRLFLSLLENCNNLTEDMYRHKEKWKRVCAFIHPFEYKDKYPMAVQSFADLISDAKVKTFYREIPIFIDNEEYDELIEFLEQRPGEFIRRIEHLFRLGADDKKIINTLNKIGKSVSNNVLLQALGHFKYRNSPKEYRVFLPKGQASRMFAIKNRFKTIDEHFRQAVTESLEKTLKYKYSQLDSLGKVYIDSQFKQYTIPFSLRSSSKTLITIPRGSRIKLEKSPTIRFFIWWKDGKTRTDIDLSALGLGLNFEFKTTIAYYNLKDLGSFHSGDITSAPDGASEFIDINVKQLLDHGVRYVVMSINSFTMQPYADLPECFAGIMLRREPQSGEIYEPKTVKNKFDLASDKRIVLPLIIDLQTYEMIWTDIGLASNLNYHNNVAGNLSAMSLLVRSIIEQRKLSLYELINLHAEARGELVYDKKNADLVFSENGDIKPTDIALILANYI